MKANGVPEKIYVSNYSSGLTYNWHNERLAVNDIEYSQTDAFIEKAEGWLREVQKGFVLTDKDITDFKNYMKRE